MAGQIWRRVRILPLIPLTENLLKQIIILITDRHFKIILQLQKKKKKKKNAPPTPPR